MVWNIFFMFGGVAAMMLGMKIMGSALEKVASGGMKKMLGKVTTNRFAGVGIGLAVTSVIQSSTATTVMLVGFVNIGLMSLLWVQISVLPLPRTSYHFRVVAE